MILKKDIKGIIFDLDGTMLDSLGMWSSLDQAYLEEKGIEAPEGLSSKTEGFTFAETAQYFKDRFGLKEDVEDIVKEWHDYIEKIYPGLPFKKGVRDFIESSIKEGKKIALATANSRKLAGAVLKAQDYIDYFEVLVSADEVGRGKPHPDVFLEAAKRLDLKPEDCLVFEDTLMGVVGAKRAGMTTIAVFDKYNGHNWEEILQTADYTIEDYGQLASILV